jgi:hypothetical protein
MERDATNKSSIGYVRVLLQQKVFNNGNGNERKYVNEFELDDILLKSLKSRKTSILIVFTAGLEPAVS